MSQKIQVIIMNYIYKIIKKLLQFHKSKTESLTYTCIQLYIHAARIQMYIHFLMHSTFLFILLIIIKLILAYEPDYYP